MPGVVVAPVTHGHAGKSLGPQETLTTKPSKHDRDRTALARSGKKEVLQVCVLHFSRERSRDAEVFSATLGF